MGKLCSNISSALLHVPLHFTVDKKMRFPMCYWIVVGVRRDDKYENAGDDAVVPGRVAVFPGACLLGRSIFGRNQKSRPSRSPPVHRDAYSFRFKLVSWRNPYI